MQQYTTAYIGTRRQGGGSARGRGKLDGPTTTERRSKGGEPLPLDQNAPPGAPSLERGSAWRAKKWEAPSGAKERLRPGRAGGRERRRPGRGRTTADG